LRHTPIDFGTCWRPVLLPRGLTANMRAGCGNKLVLRLNFFYVNVK
jgi:hypothetical protein